MSAHCLTCIHTVIASLQAQAKAGATAAAVQSAVKFQTIAASSKATATSEEKASEGVARNAMSQVMKQQATLSKIYAPGACWWITGHPSTRHCGSMHTDLACLMMQEVQGILSDYISTHYDETAA